MEWNKLDYDFQMKIIDRIAKLIDKEKDEFVRDGLIAAVHELEVWSNSPCLSLEDERYPEDKLNDFEESPFISFATEQNSNDKPN